jgi:Raf kinase inhibitor-like YbhB/YbcL family protein
MSKSRVGIVFAMLLALSFLAGTGPAAGQGKMEITSPAFKDGGTIPTKFTMPGVGGSNVSIPLAWKNAPEGTKSFALSIVDPHPVANNWVHWLVVNIPADADSIPEKASRARMPSGAVELKNSFGDVGYGGPQPPKRSGRHPYVVTIYALSTDKVDTGGKSSLSVFQEAIKGKVIAEAKITGYYME